MLQPLKSISVAEDRKDHTHQASPNAGKIRSSDPLEMPASATLQKPCADSASLFGYVSWLEAQYQQAVEATNVPAVHSNPANLPHHNLAFSRYPLGLPSLPQVTNSNQMYWCLPAAHSKSLPTNQAVGACRNWNGMPFPLHGSSVECTGEMKGSVAGLGSIDTSVGSDNLASLAHQYTLEASGHKFSGGEAIMGLMLMLKQSS